MSDQNRDEVNKIVDESADHHAAIAAASPWATPARAVREKGGSAPTLGSRTRWST